MAQQFDHTWLIYKEVIDETIKNSATLQSDAVLAELRTNWLRHLAEHLKAQQVANGNRSTVKNEPVVKIKKEPTTLDPLTTGVSPPVPSGPVSNVWCTTGNSRGFDPPPVTSSELPSTNVWGMNVPQPPPNDTELPEVEVVAEKVVEKPIVVETVSDEEGEDDEWGNWEDPNEIEIKQIAANEEKIKAAATLAAQKTVKAPITEAHQLESALAQNPSIPKDDDFTTTLRTQYGTSNKAGFVDDPDDVNSDLEELSSLSDNEPEATDYIIGQCEELIKPGGRKAQVQGTWKISLRGGIASIGGREFLFDRLEANLDF